MSPLVVTISPLVVEIFPPVVAISPVSEIFPPLNVVALTVVAPVTLPPPKITLPPPVLISPPSVLMPPEPVLTPAPPVIISPLPLTLIVALLAVVPNLILLASILPVVLIKPEPASKESTVVEPADNAPAMVAVEAVRPSAVKRLLSSTLKPLASTSCLSTVKAVPLPVKVAPLMFAVPEVTILPLVSTVKASCTFIPPSKTARSLTSNSELMVTCP